MGTDAYNKTMKERRDKIEATVRPALMGVLAALYESGLVTKVNMGDVLKLFGAHGDHLRGMENSIVDFNSPGFQADYAEYQEDLLKQDMNELTEMLNENVESSNGSMMDTIKDLMDESKSMDAEDIEQFFRESLKDKTLH